MKTMRKYLLRFFFFLIGESKLYYEMVVENKLFPQETDPKELLELLIEAKKNVPYYQKHLPNYPELGPNFLSEYEKMDFKLEKAELKKDIYQILNPRIFKKENIIDYEHGLFRALFKIFKKDVFVPLQTGGSTGNPLHFYRSKHSGLRFLLQFLAIAKYTGWQEGEGYMVCFQQGAYSQLAFIGFLMKLLGLPLFLFEHIDAETTKDFVKKLNKHKPTILFGFPSYLSEFASLIKKKELKIIPSLKAIQCAGEMLFDNQESIIKEVFGTNIVNMYGSNEQALAGITAMAGTKCDKHSGLHIFERYVFLENDNEGQILTTVMDSNYMPLIKYATGDRGEIRYEECCCGIKGKKLINLEGRIEEYLLDTKGEKIFASYLRQLIQRVNEDFYDAVLRSQFKQKKSGELSFQIQLMDKEHAESVLKYLTNKIGGELGLKVEGEVVDKLFQEKGKFKFLIRE